MFFIVVAIILALVLVGALLVGVSGEPGGYGVAAFVAVVFVVFTLICSATTVGARSVGIQTAFGKYQSTLDSGLHWTSPWSSVEQFSTNIQPLDLDGKGESVSVSYKGGGSGDVNATVRWQIDAENAEKLWKKYRTFNNVRDQLVSSSAKDSFRVVLGEYTPTEARAGENLRPITEAVLNDLRNNLRDDGVKIDSISVKRVDLDAATQRSLERIVQANNDVERAKADQERAKIDAATAKLRETQGALSPQALVRLCLDVTNAWDVSKNGPLPATWNCVGNSAPVLVGAK